MSLKMFEAYIHKFINIVSLPISLSLYLYLSFQHTYPVLIFPRCKFYVLAINLILKPY